MAPAERVVVAMVVARAERVRAEREVLARPAAASWAQV
jgi:hypothetical protein